MAQNQDMQQHPNVKARIRPHNADAEAAALGCVLLSEEAAVRILNDLKESDFFSKAHASILRAMQNIYARNVPVDFVTLVEELDTLGLTDAAGGIEYITKLTDIVPSAANYKYYVDIIKKDSTLRKLIDASEKIIECAYTGDPAGEAITLAEREIYSIAEKGDTGSFVPISVATGEVVDKLEELSRDPKATRGITTGFSSLNRLLNGLQRSDLILLAARPGQGKTSIGMNIIQNAALSHERKSISGKPDPYVCAVFSLEMPYTQLAKRMLCSLAMVDMSKCNAGNISAAEWKRLLDAKARLDKAKIHIYDSSAMTPMEIVSRCRRLKREHGLDLVMIDYLQLMTMGGRVESRQQEISTITRMMKIAARELDVPILLLSQMSRAIEQRKGRPQMSDLRESGAIEQDADIIMFIYREHDANEPNVSDEEKNKVELIIAKHRNGAQGTINLRWEGPYVRFVDIDNTHDETSAPSRDGTFIMDNDAPLPSDDDFDNAVALDDVPLPDDAPDDGQELSDAQVEEIMKADPNDTSDIF